MQISQLMRHMQKNTSGPEDEPRSKETLRPLVLALILALLLT
jgi:hypothetical protein